MTKNTNFNTNMNLQISSLLESNKNLPASQRQIELEEFMNDVGTAKFLNNIDLSNEVDEKYLNTIVKDLTEKLTYYIKAKYDEHKRSAGRGAKPAFVCLLEATTINAKGKKVKVVSIDQLSYLTVRHILNNLSDEKLKVNHTAMSLASDILSTIEVDLVKMSVLEKVGYFLVESFTNCFDEWCSVEYMFANSKSKNKEYLIIATEKYLDFVEENRDKLAELSVQILPMVSAPADWDEKGFNGGFLTSPFKRGIVKGKYKRVNQRTIDVVNRIQSTPFRVNKTMLELVEALNISRPSTLDKTFPQLIENPYEADIFNQLSDAPWDEKTEAQKNLSRKFSSKVKAYKKSVCRRNSVAVSFQNALEQAQALQDEEKIYFPHDLDYRIRLYNMVMTGLNTQGSDVQKCMLEFAKGRRIVTKGGERWLKINLANLCGQDKLHVDDRVKWVEENEEYIREQVANRLTSTEWHSWDKPLQGMAVAMEYVQWLDNPMFEFRTQGQLDGKCNGIQHLTAMTRDEKVAPEVGLVDTGKKGGDIYNLVLNQLTQALLQHPDRTFVDEWTKSGLVNRNLTKKPVNA